MTARTPEAKFDLGTLVATPGALDALKKANLPPSLLIARHVIGDWGNVCAEDKASNDEALRDGTRLISSYSLNPCLPHGRDNSVWIITEADRSVTTILLPEEY